MSGIKGSKGGRPKKSIQAKKKKGSFNETRDKDRVEGKLQGLGVLEMENEQDWTDAQKAHAAAIVKWLCKNELGNAMHQWAIKEYVNNTHDLNENRNRRIELDTRHAKDAEEEEEIKKLRLLEERSAALILAAMQQREQQFGLTPLDAARLVNSSHITTDKEKSAANIASYGEM